MTNQSIIFENDRPWLAKQPGMNPWDEGCAMLSGQLAEWVAADTERVCGRKIERGDREHLAFASRQWRCWSLHWRLAAEELGSVDGPSVAESLRKERCCRSGRHLQGDPLRDVILAEAMVRQDDRALLFFENEYRRALAGEWEEKFRQARADHEWWGEWLERLIGIGGYQPRLASYEGQAGLRAFLRIATRRFLLSRYRTNTPPIDPADVEDQGGESTTPERRFLSEICLKRILTLFRSGLAKLSGRHATMLVEKYAEGKTGREIAAELRIHPGNVSKGLERAAELLRQILEPMESEEVTECSRQLTKDDRQKLGAALFDAMRDHAREDES